MATHLEIILLHQLGMDDLIGRHNFKRLSRSVFTGRSEEADVGAHVGEMASIWKDRMLWGIQEPDDNPCHLLLSTLPLEWTGQASEILKYVYDHHGYLCNPCFSTILFWEWISGNALHSLEPQPFIPRPQQDPPALQISPAPLSPPAPLNLPTEQKINEDDTHSRVSSNF